MGCNKAVHTLADELESRKRGVAPEGKCLSSIPKESEDSLCTTCHLLLSTLPFFDELHCSFELMKRHLGKL
jgi:hypothetical protein